MRWSLLCAMVWCQNCFSFQFGTLPDYTCKVWPPKITRVIKYFSYLLSVAMNKFLFFPNSKTQRASHLHYWFKSNSNFAKLVLGLLRILAMQKLKPDCGESQDFYPTASDTCQSNRDTMLKVLNTGITFLYFSYGQSQSSLFMGKIEQNQTRVYGYFHWFGYSICTLLFYEN